MEKKCQACGKAYNSANKKYCSMECFHNSPRVFTKFKQFDDSSTSHIKINSPEFAYTLGFLWGDGSLREKKCKLYSFYYPTIHIDNSDFIHLEKIIQHLGHWRKRVIPPRVRQPQSQCMAILYDKSMGRFLVDNDYLIKSTASPTKILSRVPKHLKHYWWRGFADADGCFYVSKNNSTVQFSLAGSFCQDWTDVQDMLSSIDVGFKTITRKTKTGNSSLVRVCGVFNVERIGKYLYQGDSSISLERKFLKFKEVECLAQIASAKSKNKGRSGNVKRLS